MNLFFSTQARLSHRESSAQDDGLSKAKNQQIFTRGFSVRKSSAAFTLVELLIVLAIIGLLSSVVIASTTASRIKARDVRRIGDLKEIQLALALYYDVNKTYPAALSTIVTDRYLPSIPSDPDAAKSYEYSQLNSGKTYCLGANLEGTAPTDIPDADCAISSSGLGVTADTWFKAKP